MEVSRCKRNKQTKKEPKKQTLQQNRLCLSRATGPLAPVHGIMLWGCGRSLSDSHSDTARGSSFGSPIMGIGIVEKGFIEEMNLFWK